MTVMRIEPIRGIPPLRLRELWEFRELLGLLVWRDLRIRYKQTILGVLWAVLPSLMAGLLYTIIFGKLVRVQSEGVPYAVFFFSASLPWNMFSGILNQTSNSLTGNAHLIQKVYFPRLILPLEAVAIGMIDFVVSLAILAGVKAYYGITPPPQIVWAPLFIVLAVVSALAIGLWVAGLHAYFRDVGMMVPYGTQVLFFVTPIVYSGALYPEPWRTVLKFIPLANVVNGMRWSVLGVGSPPDALVALSSALMIGLMLTGTFFFRRVERTIVDVV